MQLATKEQVKAINAILATRGLMEGKQEMVHQFTTGRTERSSELYFNEAHELLQALNKGIAPSLEQLQKDRMCRKILAIANKIGMVTKTADVDSRGRLFQKRDYARLEAWLIKFSYLHKPLKQYSYDELPALITQMEKVEKQYISKL